jgi:hypothetical protein
MSVGNLNVIFTAVRDIEDFWIDNDLWGKA